MKWIENENLDIDYVKKLANKINADEILVKILLNRGIEEEDIDIILVNQYKAIQEPSKLVNGVKVAERIKHHIEANSVIIIDADYDSDGLNSGYIMYGVIKDIINKFNSNSELTLYYPEREEGYGLSKTFVNYVLELKEKNYKNILVITVDNGISQKNEIQELIDNNIEVVVTDHHKNRNEEVVPNCLICNPHNSCIEQDDTYKHLAGAGVAYKVCELLQRLYGFNDMRKYIVNLAIATITDMMPLTNENIAFIKYGLEILNSNECPENFKYLKDFLGIEVMTHTNIGWEIGPMLNACGRMGNSNLGGAFLLAEDEDEIVELANKIIEINDYRKELSKVARQKISKINFDNDYFCIINVNGYPSGLNGILAGDMVKIFNKPSIVVSEHNGILHGSARSIPGLDLHHFFNIELTKGNILNFGGHSEAAGIAFEANKIDIVRNSLNNSIAEIINDLILNNEFNDNNEENTNTEDDDTLLIDECIEIYNLNKDSYRLINEIICDNSRIKKPIFAILDCEVISYSQTKSNENNLMITIKKDNHEVKLWCEGMTKIYEELNFPKKIHIAGYIEKNFMSKGKPYILKVIDILKAKGE